MLRKTSVLLLLLLASRAGFAAKRVTIDQLEQALSALQGKPDLAASQRISDLELTERMSAEKLARWRAAFPGEKSSRALTTLADKSVFLAPPKAELPAILPPDVTEQRQMMALTVAYVGKTMPQLPNFLATRTTDQFEDTPQVLVEGFTRAFQPLHFVNGVSATVLYRDGHETVDAGLKKVKSDETLDPGLSTFGVFGPILGTVLVDASKSKLYFGHWEGRAGDPVAVFEFAVPREKSHYQVEYCCVLDMDARTPNMRPFQEFEGYQGEIEVDPKTGTVLGLTLEAEMHATDPVTRADLMVEYGPVEIGGRTYFCPVRSVSLTLAHEIPFGPRYHRPIPNENQPLQTLLNDVRFDQYHLFRSETRILADAEAGGAARTPDAKATDPGSATASTRTAAPGAGASEPAAPSVPSAAGDKVSGERETAEAAAASAPVPPPPPELPEIAISPVNEPPDSAAHGPEAGSSGTGSITLRTTARLVDVGMVAFDKKGRPVTDLKPEDIEIYDNGRKQEVRFFGQAAGEAAQQAEAPAQSDPGGALEFSNRRGADPQPGAAPNRIEGGSTILMIDSSSLAFGDLSYAREEVLRFLKKLPEDEQVALYILRSFGLQVLLEPTADHARVAARLTAWMPNAQDLSHAQDEESQNRQSFDFVHSPQDLAGVNGNAISSPESLSQGQTGQVASLAAPPDAKLRSLGDNPGGNALSQLAQVARHLATLPGHKSLVWIASDNVLADWAQAEASHEDMGNKFLDEPAIRAREAMNEAHVSIYPLDASQLEGGGIGADIGTRNVLAVGMSDRDRRTAGMGDAASGMKPGRDTARMQQDLHPIQGIYRDLAQATGGRALRRASDIAGELNGIAADGRAAYLLSFHPDTEADGKYHALTLKVANRRDITLRYRTGYLYAKEPSSLKDRFREAVWAPGDETEIGIGGKLAQGDGSGTLQLHIATTDVDLAQQGDRWTGTVDVFLVMRDDATMRASVSGRSFRLQLKPGTYQKLLHEGIGVEQPLSGMPESGIVRVIAVDENSGRVGSLTLPATRPPGAIKNQ